MRIHEFHYTPEDVDCRLCANYPEERKLCKVCPWLAERIEAGVTGYEEAVHAVFSVPFHKSDSSRLSPRLHTAVLSFSGSLFLDSAHRQRMEEAKIRAGLRRSRDTPMYFAAMYLLTASGELFRRSIHCYGRTGISFQRVEIRGISPHDYTLLSAAKELYRGERGVSLDDLSNTEIVDTVAFTLIINAMLIARYGCAVLEIKERRGVR